MFIYKTVFSRVCFLNANTSFTLRQKFFYSSVVK